MNPTSLGRACLLALILLSLAGPLRAQSTLYTFYGDDLGDAFVVARSAGDVDADGIPDLIVGAIYADTPQGPNSGRVYVFSGATGVLLHSLEGQASGDWLGGSVASAGDHDGDGFDDFAVATWGDDTGAHDGGAVRVHSGRTGAVLLAIFGDVDSEALGIRMDAGGDFDGDGTPDLALAAPDLNPSSTDSGRLLLYSGRDASLLFVLDGQEDGDFFPGPISFLGDLDGDGKDELSVGAIGGLDLFGQATGWVKVFAGSAALGTRFCTAAPNSSGLGAELVARGSDRVSSDALQLEAAPIPAGSGSFFYGSTTLQLPFGDGYRCVGGALGRIATVQSSGGLLRVEVQLSAPSSVATTIAAGSTWNFQALYLDPQAGGAGFNLTDAVSILFRP